MFTTLDLIKKIINNKFIQTNQLTSTYKGEIIDKNELIPEKYSSKEEEISYKVRRDNYNIFNKDKLKVIEKPIKTKDEINSVYFIISYICKNMLSGNPIPTFALIDFYNLRRYETSKEILYKMYCTIDLSLSGMKYIKFYRFSFVINKDLSNLNKILQINELYEIRDIRKKHDEKEREMKQRNPFYISDFYY